MALITRLTRLLRADLHAVLDRVEEPEVLLRQSLREMEEALSRDEQTFRRREREREQLSKREADLQQALVALADELDVCFAAGQEDLARSLIRRRLETERALQLLLRRRRGLASLNDQLARRLDDQRARYQGLRQQAELWDAEQHESEAADDWPDVAIRVRDEDVEVALLRERQRRATSCNA